MKTLILSTVVIATMLCTSSCKKDYTCICEQGWISITTEEINVKARDEDDALDKCFRHNGGSIAGAVAGRSCKLK